MGLISAILGYLLGRLFGGGSSDDSCKEECDRLRAELASCKADLEKSRTTVASGVAAGASSIAFDAAAAKAIFGKTIKQDDLTIIEGIGPKIKELFHSNGVNTWKSLGATSVERCQEILNSGGERYKAHNPGTWPKQAQMAYEGKWQELLDWQDVLDGGKE